MATPLKTTSLPDAVYDAVRQNIVTAAVDPGTLVTETAIALEYGVARPTAKAALERLVSEGLLTRQAHKTARVPVLDRDDIVDLYANRALIEQEAIQNLAKLGVVPSDALILHRELLDSVRLDDRAALASTDIDFHRALVLGQSSPRLARMHGLIMGEIELGIGQVQAHQLMTPADVAEQHEGILDALKAGDIALSGRLTREHIFTARDRLLRKYDADHTKDES